eukprot:7883599-Heterocapsa_arctica.AAC.1
MKTAFILVLEQNIHLAGDQIRAELVERALHCWVKILEHDVDGDGLEHFIEETGNRNERGGAKQIAVFAQIHKTKVEDHAYGMDTQVVDGGELELEQT